MNRRYSARAMSDLDRLTAALQEQGADVHKLRAAARVHSPVLFKSLEVTVHNNDDRFMQLSPSLKRVYAQLMAYLADPDRTYAADKRVQSVQESFAKTGRRSEVLRINAPAWTMDALEKLNAEEIGDILAEALADHDPTEL